MYNETYEVPSETPRPTPPPPVAASMDDEHRYHHSLNNVVVYNESANPSWIKRELTVLCLSFAEELQASIDFMKSVSVPDNFKPDFQGLENAIRYRLVQRHVRQIIKLFQ